MTSDEIKISRHLKTFGRRSHGKTDLLDLLRAEAIAVVTCALQNIKHFSVFTPGEEKIFFFDLSLTDEEFTRAGFSSFVFHLLGGQARSATDAIGETERALQTKTEKLVRRILQPEPAQRDGANFKVNSRRRHTIQIAECLFIQ